MPEAGKGQDISPEEIDARFAKDDGGKPIKPDSNYICSHASTCQCTGYESTLEKGLCYCNHYARDHS